MISDILLALGAGFIAFGIGYLLTRKYEADILEQNKFDELLTQFATSQGNRKSAKELQEDTASLHNIITKYHQQALFQANIQFWFSIIAASIGFVFILAHANTIELDKLESMIKILPGVIVDAVAYLFFNQAEEARQRATALYDRLRMDNQIKIAQEIIDSIEDPTIKSVMKAQIALKMVDIETKSLDFEEIIQNSSSDSTDT